MPTPVPVQFKTADGVGLVASHWDTGRRALGCVVAHGFTGSARNPHVLAICTHLYEAGVDVLAPDLRGHGRSGGRSTVGAAEVHDIAAAVSWLRAAGYERVAVLGWSMGGSVVLRYAGLGGDADAVVSVSAPGHWYERGTPAMRVVHWVCETSTGHLACRIARRTRIAGGWRELPESPVEVVGNIAPTPLLIVHGDADHYFPRRHAEVLAAAAPGSTLWLEPGMGHAESATSEQLMARVVSWLHSAIEPSAGRPAVVWDDDGRD